MKFRWAFNIIFSLVVIFNSCSKESADADMLVYGHAGTTLIPERWVYPPNSIESIDYAVDVLNADGVEIDVQMTADSTLILYHDERLDNHTLLSGCIPQYSSDDLRHVAIYNTKFHFCFLSTALEKLLSKNKYVCLDLKPYDFCENKIGSHTAFANALNNELSIYTHTQKQQIVCNSRDIELLNTISDTSVIKSFETENIPLGESYYNDELVHELGIKFQALNESIVADLHQKGIKFSIFNVRTNKEIETAISFKPTRIITDNIAYTNKKLKYE